MANDKTLENLNVEIETLSSTLKNQLSFNKMIETQLAQIAASIPPLKMGRSQGNLRLPLKMSTWCSPDGLTRLGDHHALTMQVGAIPQRTIPRMAWWQRCKRIQGTHDQLLDLQQTLRAMPL